MCHAVAAREGVRVRIGELVRTYFGSCYHFFVFFAGMFLRVFGFVCSSIGAILMYCTWME